jgi:glycosyltransferase involved in cell wall biosynthesis
MLTSTDFGGSREEVWHTNTFQERRFPKDDLWQAAYETLSKAGIVGELSGLALALAVSDPTCALRQAARGLASSVDLVIHEFPFSEPIFSDGFAKKEIYNSHNFQTSLFSSIAHGPGFEVGLLKLMRLEAKLVGRASQVFATSFQDMEKFRLFFGIPPQRLGICLNGYDEVDIGPAAAARRGRPATTFSRPRLLFIGSATHPNVDAGQFLLKLAQQFPDCDFVIAGGVTKALAALPRPGNVIALDRFDEAEKFKLLTESTIFLNPSILVSCAGVKAIEAMAAGLPMISTAESVCGLGVISGTHAEVVPRDRFAEAISRLIDSPKYRQQLAEEGLELALHTFTWESIASKLGKEIDQRPVDSEDASVARPLVLAFNDYPVPNASSGGMARIRNLLKGLNLDVVLLSFGSACTIELVEAGSLHVTVQKTASHESFERAINEGQSISVNDAIASFFVASNRTMCDIACAIARRAHALVFEHCYMAPLIDVLNRVRQDLPIIYSAHNVEAVHRAHMLRHHPVGAILSRFIAELEFKLIGQSELVVACTEKDEQYFSLYGVETVFVPNGCVVPKRAVLDRAVARLTDKSQRRDESEAIRVGFLASAHDPNVVAANFIAKTVAPCFPEVTFELVGTVCQAVDVVIPDNVHRLGVVDEAGKIEALASWAVALNPVNAGGGSSLKLSDYLAHGLPTINTPVGARGFPIMELEAGVVIALEHFPSTLRSMLADTAGRRRMAANAYEYAETHLDWSRITAPYRERISTLLVPPHPEVSSQRSLLVVTYRYTEPPVGGDEEYLIQVLRGLRPRFNIVDLAAIDVDHLANEYHSGSRICNKRPGAAHRVGELFDAAHYFKPDMVSGEEMLARRRRLERARTEEEFALFASFAGDLAGAGPQPGGLRVFAGFYDPENHVGIIRRWTSPLFSFLVPVNAVVFHLAGYAGADKRLIIKLIALRTDGSFGVLAEAERDISSQFAVTVALPWFEDDGNARVLLCAVDEHSVDGDHRPFGVLLEAALVIRGAMPFGGSAMMDAMEESRADLTVENDSFLRSACFNRWADALAMHARTRAPALDEDFAALCGPHSSEMLAWLRDHCARYDTVLMQGIPFDLMARVFETLGSLDRCPHIVTLPHFHGDDSFYHWRPYLASFAVMDSTILGLTRMRPSKTWGCYGRPGHETEGQNEVACRDGGDGCEWDRPRS